MALKGGVDVCLIAPGHLSSTPRLVREADALSDAGLRVRVVYGRHFPPADALDHHLLLEKRWSAVGVPIEGKITRKLKQVLGRAAIQQGGETAVRNWAHWYFPASSPLGRVASQVAARLYHAHCMEGLAALRRIRAADAQLGFDVEDFHPEETDGVREDAVARTAIRTLMADMLPQCGVLTAASPGIARRCRDSFGVMPQVILNVYPHAELRGGSVPAATPPPDEEKTFYWFSQTIGPGRGIEEALEVLHHMKTRARLVLRGFVDADFRDWIMNQARLFKISEPVFLAPEDPRQMVDLCAGYNLGLSLERQIPPNRDICLPNKIFAYLLAGVPVWLSDTSAHRELAQNLGEAAVLDPGKGSKVMAEKLDAWLAATPEERRITNEALAKAKSRYCWETESPKFVSAVTEVISS